MATEPDGPVTVWITYDIKEGVSPDEYRKWSRERDQPMASKQPGILSYEIFEVAGAEDREPWADVMEVITAEDWDAWLAVDQAPEMKEVVQEFWDICDPDSVRVLYGHKIEP
jgi:hypothetical protein